MWHPWWSLKWGSSREADLERPRLPSIAGVMLGELAVRVPNISSTSLNLSSKSQSPAPYQSEGNEAPPLGGRKSPDFATIFHLGQSPSSRILQSTSLKKKYLLILQIEEWGGGGRREKKREIVCVLTGDQTNNLGSLGQSVLKPSELPSQGQSISV